jgi:hypothetical protein
MGNMKTLLKTLSVLTKTLSVFKTLKCFGENTKVFSLKWTRMCPQKIMGAARAQLTIITRLRAIFARDILLYYSYVRSYEALAQKLFLFLSCDHGVERRRPLPLAVVVVCPRPSISP